MRTKFILIISVAVALFTVSCKDKQPTNNDPNQPFVVIYEQEDSLAISNLTNEYVTRFNSGDFNQAADMLYFVRNDSVFPLTQDQREGYIQAMNHIGRFGCQLKDMELNTFKDNKVRIAVLLNENGSLDEERGTVNFFLNPVKVENQWYLTLYDRYAEGVGEHLNVTHERQD